MGKRDVQLTEDQQKINEAILARLAAERSRLLEETRAMQEQAGRKANRKQKEEIATAVKDPPNDI